MLLDYLSFAAIIFDSWEILIFFIAIADIITVIHILKNKHEEPTSAILWIFIIANFHIAGIFVYLLLGINRLKTTGLKISKANKSMRAARKNKSSSFLSYLNWVSPFNSKSDKEYMQILDRLLPDTYPTGGNKIELLEDGTHAYPQMIAAIEKAKKHIHLQSFIIVNDELGNKIFEALERKAKNENVKVKVLFDRLGSSKAYSSHFFKKWTNNNPNFETRVFSKFNLFIPYRIQLRNHRKILLCDGEVAFVGGINISAENDANLKSKYIHDLHCKVTGPCIGEFQFSFLKDWSFATKTDPEILLSEADYLTKPQKDGEAMVRIIPSGPGQSYEATKKLFMTIAATARKSLWIITPYFVPDKSFLDALRIAAARNVDVRILIPENNNHWYVRYASRSLYNSLLHGNIRIFEKKGRFSHVKATLIDGQWAMMGSSNCDLRSFKLNYEIDFITEGEDFVNKLHLQFLSEFEESQEITLQDREKRTKAEEILENFCSLFIPIL